MGYVRYIGADVLVTDEKSLLHYVVCPAWLENVICHDTCHQRNQDMCQSVLALHLK
jgi:hypothetical protein